MNPVPRGLRRWLRGPVLVYYHPAYRVPLAASVGAPSSPRRADDALTWAMALGVVAPEDVSVAPEISWDDAALVHGEQYLADLDQPEAVARILGADIARIPVREILETWRRAVGATVAAARRVLRRPGRAVNLFGGFHHAERDKGGGFCALNDVAIAVACLRRDGVRGRIGIVDLDAHPPDGVVQILGDDPGIVIRSLSTASAWTVPTPSAADVVDARVPAGTTDDAYLAAVDALLVGLPPVEIALYLAGADPLVGDKLGGLAVSEAGLRARDRRVFEVLGRTPTVVVPAGGYADASWRVLAGTIAETAGDRTAVAPGFDPVHHRTRRVMRTLDPRDLGGDDEVLVTEEELLGGLGAAPRSGEPRFLGYYTRHGLEHALTAYGYLSTLRRLGFADLAIELQVGTAGAADRMRITADVAGAREVLVDLAASIRPIDRHRTLFVEWLELRDPRAPFATHRPRLPGQQRPGLGLAEETIQILVRAAERLGLDGVSFVPSHWHVAWMARDRFVAADPVERGRLRAMSRAVAGMPLVEATALLAGPG
ncbi:MAG: histone deacetylase, partial [Myxococcota bacterium]